MNAWGGRGRKEKRDSIFLSSAFSPLPFWLCATMWGGGVKSMEGQGELKKKRERKVSGTVAIQSKLSMCTHGVSPLLVSSKEFSGDGREKEKKNHNGGD